MKAILSTAIVLAAILIGDASLKAAELPAPVTASVQFSL
jgi:hypothetical protein